MALVLCRECQQEISENATPCPHCGVPHPTEAQKEAHATALKQGQVMALIFVGSLLFLFFGIPIILFGWPLIVGGFVFYLIVRIVRFFKNKNAAVVDQSPKEPQNKDESPEENKASLS